MSTFYERVCQQCLSSVFRRSTGVDLSCLFFAKCLMFVTFFLYFYFPGIVCLCSFLQHFIWPLLAHNYCTDKRQKMQYGKSQNWSNIPGLSHIQKILFSISSSWIFVDATWPSLHQPTIIADKGMYMQISNVISWFYLTWTWRRHDFRQYCGSFLDLF